MLMAIDSHDALVYTFWYKHHVLMHLQRPYDVSCHCEWNYVRNGNLRLYSMLILQFWQL